MEVKKLERKFIIEEKGKKITVGDPDSKMTIEQVKEHLSNLYPSLINARGHDIKFEENTQIIEFTTSFAPKG